MEEMKLNIQKFEGEGAVTVETIGLDEIASIVKNIGTACTQILGVVGTQLKGIENYDEQLKGVFSDNAEIITKTASAFGGALIDLSTLAAQVASSFDRVYPQYVSQFKAWGEDFNSAYGAIKTGYTAQGVEKGSYSASQYVSDASKSVLTISDNTRESVKEVANLIGNTGKILKSTTGYSAQDIVHNAVGTMSTLLNNTSSESSVLGRIMNFSGSVLSFMRNMAS